MKLEEDFVEGRPPDFEGRTHPHATFGNPSKARNQGKMDAKRQQLASVHQVPLGDGEDAP